MSWLSKKVGGWWDKASGANQKYDPNQLGNEYDTSMQGVNAGYDKISEYAEGMMDPNSQQNQNQRSMMNQQGADAAAQSSRMAGRNAAMAGGAPAGALAAQTASTANQSLAGSNNAFNQYLQGAQGQGASMLSGVLANQGQMQNQKFQMVNNQRQANAQADTQGAQFGANLLGSAIGMIPGLGQRGGEVGTDIQEGGMAYDNMDHHIAYDGYQNGGSVGADGKQHYFLGGLAASIGMGALKKGYDSLEGGNFGDKVDNIKGSLGKLGEGIQEGVSEMKQQAGDTDYHKDESAARDAGAMEYSQSEEGLKQIGDWENLGTSNKEFNAANKNMTELLDDGTQNPQWQSREQVGKARISQGMNEYRDNYDIEGGKHRVGATRAGLEDFRNSDTTKMVGKGIAGTYGLAKEGVGVAKDAIVGGTGLLAGAIGTGAGAVGKGAMTAGKAIKKDWQKEKGSIGKGLLSGASQLLKEVGSPGYLRGKEMADVKYGKVPFEPTDEDDTAGTTTPPKKPETQLDPTATSPSQRVAQPNDDNRVEVNGQKIVPDALLSKVKSTTDLANLDPEQIKNIQASLKAAGYDMTSSEVDGGMDGKAGPDTMKRMQEYIEKQGKQQGGFIAMAEGGDPQQLRDQELRNRIGQAREDSGLYSVNRNESGGIQGSSLNRRLKGTEGFEDWDERKSLLRQSVSAIEAEHYGEAGAPVKGYGGGDPNRLEMNMLRQEGYISPQQGGQSMGEEARQEYDEYQKKEPSFGSGMMQEGGTVWNPAKPTTNHSGMLSRVMGPNGEMGIKTRMGGFKIG